jgi:hypothetical protein
MFYSTLYYVSPAGAGKYLQVFSLRQRNYCSSYLLIIIINANVYILEYFADNGSIQVFSMHGYYRSPTVAMQVKTMAALLADILEAMPF